MTKYENLVKFWLTEFVGDESKYTINVVEKQDNMTIEISLDKSDMGKIIGKNGNIITALRNFINSISNKDKKNVRILVKDI
ncbi:KH domain-containing protein [Oceanivirga salmonicida]|uniref:KH domain-containing protein n=1 Tax=Oceanivirga salmonicida TaxID=1769291 RepID=UPI000831DAD3|nr:KH domain-containing protein [Oceanivirga salmonicida]